MQTKLRVKRYDPEGPEPASSVQEYDLEVPEHYTVLDALIKVREEVDPSLALRCSCRASICGSCAMTVNDTARLVCKTKLRDVGPEGQPVSVEPMRNQRVVKDLVVDLQLFWGKIRAVEPYLQPKGPEPEDEYIAPNDAMLNLLPAMGCIMCGACVSACTVLEVDSNFLGPAALGKGVPIRRRPPRSGGPSASGDTTGIGRGLGLHAVLLLRRGVPRRASRRWTGSWNCARH